MAQQTEMNSHTINVNVETREIPKENRRQVPVNVYPYTAKISWFPKFGESITISENRYAFFKAESTITIGFNHDLLDGKGLTHSIEISIGWIRSRGLIPTFYRAASWSEHAYVVYESNECYKKWKMKPNCSEIKRIDDKLSKLSFASKYDINELHNSNPVEYEQTLAAYKRRFILKKEEKVRKANEIIERLIQEAPAVCRNEYKDSYTFYRFLRELGPVNLFLDRHIPGQEAYVGRSYIPDRYERTDTGKFKDAFDTKTRDERLRFCSKVFEDNEIVGRSKTDDTKDFNGNLFPLNAQVQSYAQQKIQSQLRNAENTARKKAEAAQAKLNALAAEEARDIAECKELLTQKGYSVSNQTGGRRTRRRSRLRKRTTKARR
jgi:hypothetical protein